MKIKKLCALTALVMIFVMSTCQLAYAQIFYVNDKIQYGGIQFDSDFYGLWYPDIKAACGNDPKRLLNHYLVNGRFEDRLPAAGYARNMDDLTLRVNVPPWKLANRKSLMKGLSSQEYSDVYTEALKIITANNLMNNRSRLSRIQILTTVMQSKLDTQVIYSVTAPHNTDAYGVYCASPQFASVEGTVKALGECFNILGIAYEHVYDGHAVHQWCRVNVNGVYYVCDPHPGKYGYCGPEPAPYKHPYIP